MFISKLTKKNFINFLEKKCDNIPISNKSLGILIRSIHINLPIIILIIVSCGSKTSAIIHVLFLLFIVFMYIIFNGFI